MGHCRPIEAYARAIASTSHRDNLYRPINPNIKLSLEYSKVCINFLDLTVSKDNQGTLHTSVYRKPTDRNTILHAKSFHPNWLKENVPYGQFQRVKRICDQDHVFESKSLEMMPRFKERGYRSSTLQKAYTRAKHVARSSLLQRNTPKQTKERPVFVTTYSTEAEQIRQIIQKKTGVLLKVMRY